ncbi:hypothetical protein ACS0TY_030353 [Phlomoides rotata]
MEGEYKKLKPSPSFKHVIESTTLSREGSESELPRYTSLKDVISPRDGTSNTGDIAIRNELVKHAASAYVLSATIISPANKDHEWNVVGIWERMCLGFHSCWQIHVESMLDLFYHLVQRVRNGFMDSSLCF